MSTKEFGRILDEEEVITPTFQEFGRIIEEGPIPRSTRSGAGGKAVARGALKAAEDFSQLSPTNVLGEGIKNLLGRFMETPTQPSLPVSEQLIEQLGLEDPDAGLPEKSIEKAVEIFPYLLGGEGGLLAKGARALLAGGAGQIAQEAGLGDLGELGAEAVALGAPSLGKRIAPKRGQKQAVEMLRKRGLTEKEIAPIIPSERKSATLSKVGSRGFRTEKAAKRTREALGNIYGTLFEEGEQLPILSSQRSQSLQSDLAEKLKRMPSNVRRAVQSDLNDLFSKPVKANDIMNFWQDLNANINWGVLLEGIKEISPELAQDFELTNELYAKFGKLSKNLQGRPLDSFIAIGEVAGAIGQLFKFGPFSLSGIIGTEAARRLASEMLVNPRLQNLSQKMINAALNNKTAIAKKVEEQIKKELTKKGFEEEIFSK